MVNGQRLQRYAVKRSPLTFPLFLPLKTERASLDNILIIEVGEGVNGTVEADALNLMFG